MTCSKNSFSEGVPAISYLRAEWTDDKFIWYRTENFPYIFELNETGEWYETGEMNREVTVLRNDTEERIH